MSSSSPKTLSRRDFLMQTGCGAAVVATAGLMAAQPAPAQASTEAIPNGWGVLIDLTRCTGCNSCALACKAANGCPNPAVEPKELSSEAYTFVDLREADTATEPTYVKRQCMHCLHPACVSACTVGAMRKTADGPVVYDSNKCIGCRYCQYACPFGVPTFDWDNPLGLVHKCQMCVGRLEEDQKPACVSECPAGALRFGLRSRLLAQAHAQIDSNPGRYVDHVYGEHEAGGTSMLYLSGVPFSRLGLPSLDSQPVSQQAEAVMKKTPLIAATVASMASGLYWLMKRRELRLAEVEIPAAQKEQPHGH